MPSTQVLEAKKAFVADLTERLKGSVAGVIVDYKGITVADDTKLRKELREAGVNYTVVKNTLLGRAAKEVGLEGLDEQLNGTTALATSDSDYVAAARILCKYAEDNENFSVKIGFIDGKAIPENEVKELAKLPSREELVARALGGLNAPISGFAGVCAGTLRSLMTVLSAIAEKQGA
ncbi:MAG: 50S ribosomal protein L10 [Oscillospiraceae bacterium]|nr:50S ribosomal protein L10 [Candidatus Equicaccousia limihippi]